MKIEKVGARRILDSGGGRTLETEVRLDDGSQGIASVPTGISRGKHEAKFLKAEEAVKNVNEVIAPHLLKLDPRNQEKIDNLMTELDGTKNKGKLGANAILSVSIAVCKAAAASLGQPLYKYISSSYQSPVTSHQSPVTIMLMMEGGKHADNDFLIQEFMVMPENIEEGVGIYERLRELLKSLGYATAVGAEGGFAPRGISDFEALDFISEVAEGVPLALDVARSSMIEEEIDLEDIINSYNIGSLEDPFGEEEWEKWQEFTAKFGDRLLMVADDLTVTNPQRIEKAIELKAANGIIIKPTQIGTLTETLEVIRLAQEAGWKVIISHRGRETDDDFKVHLALGVGADLVKFGAPARGERIAKYNELMKIAGNLVT